MSPWIAGAFKIKTAEGRKTREGFTYRGLGLSPERVPEANEEPSLWTLTHIGSGARLAEITGTEDEAKAAAIKIAEIGFWEWGEFYNGRKNLDVGLFRRFAVLCRSMDCVRMTVRLA